MPPRKAPLRTKAPLKSAKPVRPVNPERKARRFMEAYHSEAYVEFIHAQPCVVIGCDGRDIEASHIRSRGAGGKWDEIVPMCAAHHAEFHAIGIRTWSSKYALALDIIARAHAAVWRERMGDLPEIASEPEPVRDPSQQREGDETEQD